MHEGMVGCQWLVVQLMWAGYVFLGMEKELSYVGGEEEGCMCLCTCILRAGPVSVGAYRVESQ